jgi:hypothetical protein
MMDTISMPWLTLAKIAGLLNKKEPNTPVGTDKCSPDDATLLYAPSLLDNAREEIDRADAKASILLAASGVAAGALLAGLIAGTWSPFKLHVGIQWTWWAGVVEAALGIGCLALAVYPREHKNDSGIPWAVLYYGDVLVYPTTTQLVSALNRSAETNIERIADQLRHVSWIVHYKYRLIRWGMRLLFLATATIVAAMVINVALVNH